MGINEREFTQRNDFNGRPSKRKPVKMSTA